MDPGYHSHGACVPLVNKHHSAEGWTVVLFEFQKKPFTGTSLAVQWLRRCLLLQGMLVRSLIGELRSHMPCSLRNQNTKRKPYCNKFNKDVEEGPHQKNLKKKKKAKLLLVTQYLPL